MPLSLHVIVKSDSHKGLLRFDSHGWTVLQLKKSEGAADSATSLSSIWCISLVLFQGASERQRSTPTKALRKASGLILAFAKVVWGNANGEISLRAGNCISR